MKVVEEPEVKVQSTHTHTHTKELVRDDRRDQIEPKEHEHEHEEDDECPVCAAAKPVKPTAGRYFNVEQSVAIESSNSESQNLGNGLDGGAGHNRRTSVANTQYKSIYGAMNKTGIYTEAAGDEGSRWDDDS